MLTKQQVPDDPKFVSDRWLRRLLKAKRDALTAAGDDPERVKRCVLFYQRGKTDQTYMPLKDLTQDERWGVLRDLLKIRPGKPWPYSTY
jgi:hypothetical protein